MKTRSQQPPTIPNFGTSRGVSFHYFGAKTAFSGSNTIPTTLCPHSIPNPPKREQEKMFLQLRSITPNCCAHTLKKSHHTVSSCLELHLTASASLCEISSLQEQCLSVPQLNNPSKEMLTEYLPMSLRLSIVLFSVRCVRENTILGYLPLRISTHRFLLRSLEIEAG